MPPDLAPRLQETPAFTPALAVHAADILLAEDPEHELFATARLDEPYLRSLDLWDRVPDWREGLEQDPAGLKDIPF